MDELIGGALRSGGNGVANPKSGEGGPGGAAFDGGGAGEFGVGENLLASDWAAVDREEFAFFGDEEAGGDRDGSPEIDDRGLKGVKDFDGFRGSHLSGEVCADRF